MKFPIVVDEHGDLMLFESPEELSEYLEPIDVRNDEYVAYDAAGFRVALVVEEEQLGAGLFGQKKREKVVVSDRQLEASEPELREKVTRYLAAVKAGTPANAELPELLEVLASVLSK